MGAILTIPSQPRHAEAAVAGLGNCEASHWPFRDIEQEPYFDPTNNWNAVIPKDSLFRQRLVGTQKRDGLGGCAGSCHGEGSLCAGCMDMGIAVSCRKGCIKD